MLLQNWWYTTLLGLKYTVCPPLREEITSDVLIVGAGIAGLSAALRLMDSGKKIVLLERNICGGSTTGKSAGFLTPESELELAQLVRRFGPKGAKDLWEVATKGANIIVSNIKKYNIKCDLQEQPSLYLGLGRSGRSAVQEEAAVRRSLGFQCELYNKKQTKSVIGSKDYSSAIRYDGTFGMNPLQFAQGIKQVLLEHGIQIFESSEVVLLKGNKAKTHLGSVTADEIIFCVDKIKPALSKYSKNIYHAQTFMSISEPLEKQDIDTIFPQGSFQCWDSDLIYTYFRLTGDKRLLVGGGDMITTFSKKDATTPRVIERVISKLKKKIPSLKHVQFIQYWPGRIDITRDLLPTILKKPKYNTIHFVFGCVGLPWAAFCGNLVAGHVLDEKDLAKKYYKYFSVNRKFVMPLSSQQILGKKLMFTLSNAWAKYLQVDRGKNIKLKDQNW